jgi:hypothetical protein
MKVLTAGRGVSRLVFDLACLTDEVRNMNTAETKDIFMDNVSDADLHYKLLYKEEFLSGTVGSKPVRSVNEVMYLVSQNRQWSWAPLCGTERKDLAPGASPR